MTSLWFGRICVGLFFLLPVSTMKYFTWKPKQWQREPFVLRKEINTAETGKVSRNTWFSQAMGCWVTALKRQAVLGLLKTVLQTSRIVTSLFGSELQDACFMLTPTPRIHCKRWHSGWANQLSIQPSVCIRYLQYHVCSPCQYLIQELHKPYKHRKVSISH